MRAIRQRTKPSDHYSVLPTVPVELQEPVVYYACVELPYIR